MASIHTGKVLFIANTDWYLFNFRLALANFLRAKGFEVVMVSPPGKFVPEIQKAGYRWIEWAVGRRTMLPTNEVKAIQKLTDILKTEEPVLVHHFTIKPVLYGSLAARIAHIPAVVNSVTGLGYIFLTGGLTGRFLRFLVLPMYRIAFAHPNLQVIFENGNDQNTFIRFGLIKSQDTYIIHGVGVDTEWFFPIPEPAANPPLIVFPARMLLDKGLGTLIDAARILKQKQDVRIILVGEPDPGNPATVSKDMLKDWEKEGLVEWWGFQREMCKIYQNAHIITLPSFGEGLPTVLIEAAACGRPIVTTDVSGCRDVVKDGINGLLVPPNDPASLADALETLILNPTLRKQMGEEGRRIVLEEFTNERVNEETLKVYEKALCL
jgi:glycosyltransferase involved in cell wall biosynthesis